MRPYRAWVEPLLRQENDDAKKDGDEAKRLRASLALLASDESQVDYLYDRLINATPREFDVIRRALLPHKEQLTEKLWGVVESPRSDQQYLCAVSSLALYAPGDPRWKAAAPNVAAVLARVSPFFVKYWTDALRGVQDKLVGPLSGIARDPARNANERLCATNILAACAPDRAELLTPVLIDGDEEQFAVVFPLLDAARPCAARFARGGTRSALPAMIRPIRKTNWSPSARPGRPSHCSGLAGRKRSGRSSSGRRDDRVRSYLIHWSRPLGVDPQMVIQHLAMEKDAGRRVRVVALARRIPRRRVA